MGYIGHICKKNKKNSLITLTLHELTDERNPVHQEDWDVLLNRMINLVNPMQLDIFDSKWRSHGIVIKVENTDTAVKLQNCFQDQRVGKTEFRLWDHSLNANWRYQTT